MWVRSMVKKCLRLIRETPPNGESLAKCIQVRILKSLWRKNVSSQGILQREEHWSNWKEHQCPDFTAKTLDKEGCTTVKRAPRRHFNARAPPDLGMPELNRLWHLQSNVEVRFVVASTLLKIKVIRRPAPIPAETT